MLSAPDGIPGDTDDSATSPLKQTEIHPFLTDVVTNGQEDVPDNLKYIVLKGNSY